MAPTVLASKLEVPTARAGTFERPHLVRALQSGDAATLRVVIAPTGWGKSQLLTQWLAQVEQPIAFMRLDPLDNDPSRCWTHLLTAIGAAANVELGDLIDELRAPVLPLVTEIVEPALARVGDRELLLVLDDYHVIRSAEVQESIEALVDARTTAMGACVASRTEPALRLPRRRVQDELVEIRTEDLRMSEPEAARILNQAAQTTIEAALVHQLVERTEGWAAGLYLAGLSLRSIEDHGQFVSEFAGDDRNLSDYLASEVLRSLDDDDRAFLLGVAVLDELQPDICNALLNSDDAAKRLDLLSRNNLFLIPVNQNRGGFRFHHLFKEWLELLLEQTESGAVAGAHRRAAGAYAERRNIVPAIDHAIAGQDWELSHRLLMRFGLRLIDAGNHHTVARWCSRFPFQVSPAIRFDVAAMRGWTAIIDGDLDAVQHNCRVADQALELTIDSDEPPVMSPGDIPLLRGYQQLLSGSLHAIDGTIAAAYDVGISPRTEATLRWLRAATDYWLGDVDDQAFIDATSFATSQGDPYAVTLSNAYLAHIHIDRFDLGGAQPWIEAAFSEITEHGLSNFGYPALAHLAHGRILLAKAQLVEAEAECRRAIELAGRRNDVLVECQARITLAETQHEADDRETARSTLNVVSNDIGRLETPGILADRLRVLQRQLRHRAQPQTRPDPNLPVEQLTDREITLLRLLPGSLSQRELGEALHVSFNTVKTYNRQIYRKLGVATRDEAVAAARRAGLL